MTFQLMLFPNFLEKAFTCSYDDGEIHDRKLVEIMNEYGIKGTFNLNSCYVGSNEYYVNENDIKELYLKSGHEVAIHGERHLSLASLTEEQMVCEVMNDRKNLESLTGGLVTGMAYANGSYDDRVVAVLKNCGVEYARTINATENFNICDNWLKLPTTCHHDNPKLMELADRFLNEPKKGYFWSNSPKLFYVWGHSYEFAKKDNWVVFENLAKTVGGREDVWYATNIEIVRYIQAFKCLRYSLNGKRVYNPTSIDVYIKTKTDKKVIVPAGEMVEL